MVRASRRMPQFVRPYFPLWRRWLGYGVLAVFAWMYASALFKWPRTTLAATAALVVVTVIQNRRLRLHRRNLNDLRADETICTFVRALPVRDLDTSVVRAVFEELRDHINADGTPVPLRPSDHLANDLRIDPDDLEDLALQIAQRSGRRNGDWTANPYYDKVATVEDLIRFFCAQPKDA